MMESGTTPEQIGITEQRREILDWYHLMENLHKVGGSNQRLRQARNYLWQGFLQDAIASVQRFQQQTGEKLPELSSQTPIEDS